MEKIYVVNRVLDSKACVIAKKAFENEKLAKKYKKWANKKIKSVPSWIEEIEVSDFNYELD